jgi:hypothetical protein
VSSADDADHNPAAGYSSAAFEKYFNGLVSERSTVGLSPKKLKQLKSSTMGLTVNQLMSQC